MEPGRPLSTGLGPVSEPPFSLAPGSNRRSRATTRSHPRRAAAQAAAHEARPTHPHAATRPSGASTSPRAEAKLGRQVLPRDTGVQHKQDPLQAGRSGAAYGPDSENAARPSARAARPAPTTRPTPTTARWPSTPSQLDDGCRRPSPPASGSLHSETSSKPRARNSVLQFLWRAVPGGPVGRAPRGEVCCMRLLRHRCCNRKRLGKAPPPAGKGRGGAAGRPRLLEGENMKTSLRRTLTLRRVVTLMLALTTVGVLTATAAWASKRPSQGRRNAEPTFTDKDSSCAGRGHSPGSETRTCSSRHRRRRPGLGLYQPVRPEHGPGRTRHRSR